MLHSDYKWILDPQILLKGRVNVTLCILLYFGDFDTFMVQVHIYKRDFRYLSLLSSFYNAKRGSKNYFKNVIFECICILNVFLWIHDFLSFLSDLSWVEWDKGWQILWNTGNISQPKWKCQILWYLNIVDMSIGKTTHA